MERKPVAHFRTGTRAAQPECPRSPSFLFFLSFFFFFFLCSLLLAGAPGTQPGRESHQKWGRVLRKHPSLSSQVWFMRTKRKRKEGRSGEGNGAFFFCSWKAFLFLHPLISFFSLFFCFLSSKNAIALFRLPGPVEIMPPSLFFACLGNPRSAGTSS